MRRAERLFEIIQIMRRSGLIRARDLAEQLEISERTVYRDIQAMIARGVPIAGEAGVGYVLREGFDLPPLMFDKRELEALMLGARIVDSLGDSELSTSAQNVIAKIEAVVPSDVRAYMETVPLLAPCTRLRAPISFCSSDLRTAMRENRKVCFRYTDGLGDETARTVRPLSLAYFGAVWLLAAWCELRDDFRVFRLDRINDFELTDRVFKHERGKTLRDFLAREHTWERGRSLPISLTDVLGDALVGHMPGAVPDPGPPNERERPREPAVGDRCVPPKEPWVQI
ncbi:MAG: YafY family protein [Pseudomonadota bacterium]